MNLIFKILTGLLLIFKYFRAFYLSPFIYSAPVYGSREWKKKLAGPMDGPTDISDVPKSSDYHQK